MLPLAALGTPQTFEADGELRRWQPWVASVLGGLSALDGPLGDAPPEHLRTYFHPLVVGAAALLAVLRDEADGVAIAWDRTTVGGGRVCVALLNGEAITVEGLQRAAPDATPDDAWLTALVALAQVTLQATARWPALPPTLPVALRRN
jgi:hypothetical protein